MGIGARVDVLLQEMVAFMKLSVELYWIKEEVRLVDGVRTSIE